MPDIVIADPRSDADVEAFARLDAEGFAQTVEESRGWLERMRAHALWRYAYVGDEVVGGYVLLPAGQFFGGRSVPIQAVAGVGVAPPWRRRGVAGALMNDLVTFSAEHGAALAPLQAATTRLYRRWGWEIGERSLRHRVRSSSLAALSGDGRAVASPAAPAVEALRRDVLARWDGPLDRPDWWLEVEWPAHHEHRSYGWMQGERLTGYTRYVERSGQPLHWMNINVQELIAATPDALRGLLGLLGSNEAQTEEIVFSNSSLRPRSELLFLLPDADKQIIVEGQICWMQRIVNLQAAFRARGWPAHVRGRLDLEVADPVKGAAERCVLEVNNGEARLSAGGSGRVRCGIGMLSSWYSGTLRPHDAVRMSLLDAPAEDIDTMSSLVGDRDAWMPDYF